MGMLAEGGQALLAVIGMDQLKPAKVGVLFDRAAGVLQPGLVEPGVPGLGVGLPDEDRGAVGHRAKAGFAFLKLGGAALESLQCLALGGAIVEDFDEAADVAGVVTKGHEATDGEEALAVGAK